MEIQVYLWGNGFIFIWNRGQFEVGAWLKGTRSVGLKYTKEEGWQAERMDP